MMDDKSFWIEFRRLLLPLLSALAAGEDSRVFWEVAHRALLGVIRLIERRYDLPKRH